MGQVRIIVTGSRDWEDEYRLIREFRAYWLTAKQPANPILISGHCPTGADHMAEQLWARRGYPIELHPADWKTHGKRAGFIRNAEMVNSGADVCLAFIRNASRGATMTANLAERAGIPTQRFNA